MVLRVIRPVIGLAVVLFSWWAIVTIFDIQQLFLPSPLDIADAFARQTPYLLERSWSTLGHMLGGFAIATVIGLIAAIAIVAVPWIRDTVMPMLVAIQAMPKVAFAPLLVVWLGFGPSAKMAMVTMLCFFPVLVATIAGLTSTPSELNELARSLSASRWKMFTKIRIPNALPQVFTGLKLGLSLALIGAVVAEITTPNAGLGSVVVLSGQSLDTPLAFAAIMLLAAIGVAGFYTLVGLERLTLPWARATTS